MHTFTDVNGKADVTWYERSGLIQYQARLYFICCKDQYSTADYAMRMRSRVRIHAQNEFPSMKPHIIDLWFVDAGTDGPGNVVCGCAYKHGSLRSTVVFRRAQALIKLWASKRIANRKAKQLAFAMAWHWRLGGQSTVAAVPEDFVKIILDTHAKAPKRKASSPRPG